MKKEKFTDAPVFAPSVTFGLTNMTELEFKRLTFDDLKGMLPYFRNSDMLLSDYSAAFKWMWQKHFALEFAYVENCLVFREEYQGRTYFHYPMRLKEDDDKRAVDAVEEYCRKNNLRIHFTAVPREKLMGLIGRYGMEMRITNHRRWRDYLYRAEDFIGYSGKKFNGQRNHVNKFTRLYPNFVFTELTERDESEIKAFLDKFSARQLGKGSVMAAEELESVYALVPHIGELNLSAGALRIDGNIVAVSIGERCGEQLVIHVEKALTEYAGVYPAMAQQFAKRFVADGVKYINREDDAGDAGLRKSKLQYNPVCLVDKYDVFPRRVIDRLTHLPVIRSERLTVKEVSDLDGSALYALEMEVERNKFWGYDWREHTQIKSPTPEFFLQGLREDFKNREEMPMGVYLGNKMIGEVVLHNFGYRNDCEIGMRLLPAYEGYGYAREAVQAVMNYAFYDLNMERLLAKCHKENQRSRNTLLAVGFRPCGEDDVFYYFHKTAAM